DPLERLAVGPGEGRRRRALQVAVGEHADELPARDDRHVADVMLLEDEQRVPERRLLAEGDDLRDHPVGDLHRSASGSGGSRRDGSIASRWGGYRTPRASINRGPEAPIAGPRRERRLPRGAPGQPPAAPSAGPATGTRK